MAWPVLDAGTLRHPIKIWGTTVAGDVSGTTMDPFLLTSPDTVASIEPVRGSDIIRGGQDTTQLFLVIKMWFQPGITAGMTVEAESGSKYLIQSIENLSEMNIVLVLNCLGMGPNQ